MELHHVDILILGAGWTSTFLIPLLQEQTVDYAATSTTGRTGTIKFVFDPSSDDPTPFKVLPSAQTIIITFPLKGKGQSARLLDLYAQTHDAASPHYMQLGSTGIWQIEGQDTWVTRHSRYNTSNDRAVAEDELRTKGGCVLNLSGLWGGQRQPRDWVVRVAPTKEALKAKKSVHLVHGQDVARAIIGLHRNFTAGERWMLTDMFVYDWWSLALGWGNGGSVTDGKDAEGPHMQWVRELMVDEGIKALPRDMETLGRCYDSREFWDSLGLAPVRARI